MRCRSIHMPRMSPLKTARNYFPSDARCTVCLKVSTWCMYLYHMVTVDHTMCAMLRLYVFRDAPKPQAVSGSTFLGRWHSWIHYLLCGSFRPIMVRVTTLHAFAQSVPSACISLALILKSDKTPWAHDFNKHSKRTLHRKKRWFANELNVVSTTQLISFEWVISIFSQYDNERFRISNQSLLPSSTIHFYKACDSEMGSES